MGDVRDIKAPPSPNVPAAGGGEHVESGIIMVDYAATTVYNYTDYPVDGKIKFFTDADGFKWVKWNEGKRGQAGHVVIPKASIRRIQYLDRCQL